LLEGSLIACNLFLLQVLQEANEDRQETLTNYMGTIYIQQMDISYDSVDFDDPISTLSYFKKLYRSCTFLSEEEVERRWKSIMLFIKMKTEEGSTKSAEVQLHHIMRSAAEKIHGALNQDSDSVATPKQTSEFVTLVMTEAIHNIIGLL
jgi:viroplasmin and RNaseH domain-containing protein